MIDVFVSKEPQNPNKPLIIIEFPRGKPDEPALELHVWMFRGQTQVEWLTEDGEVLGVAWGVQC